MKPYRYPQKLRPDVDFTTLRRNLSYITTQIFLRRHVISRTSGEITRILYEIIIASCSFFQKETPLINNEYMTIGQAKAKPYWFALCLTDVFYNSSIILLIVSNIPGSLFLTTSKTIDSSMSK